ncbi:MAG: UxaA family hydrolase [bacterium]
MSQASAGQPFAVVVLGRNDNVAVAARPLPKGFILEHPALAAPVEVRQVITLGHKVATRPIAKGEPVLKYGQIIGFASKEIAPGDWVHVHNISADAFERDYAFATAVPPAPVAARQRTFQGYLRPDGRVGTRNTIAVISTVNCSASTSRMIAERVRSSGILNDYPHVDSVFAITHKAGCGFPFEGMDFKMLERVMAGFANHPNVAAYLLVGLGCEGTYPSHLVESHDLVLLSADPSAKGADKAALRPQTLSIQEQGGIARTIEAAFEGIKKLLPQANQWRRTEQPASKICLALECGGSDGNSGVTANPALGVAADMIVAQGGTAVLAETTEVYGAEHLLTQRAVSREVGQKLVDKIKWWEWYADVFGGVINNNPSPGNKNGGLTTIYEKSLGAVAKAGSTAMVDVLDYAAPCTQPGLLMMDTPGFDPTCTTGLVAGGANVLVFTTGRGSVLGLKPTPCLKVTTNTPLFQRMPDEMDFDAGTILAGESVESVGERMFEEILAIASGKPTKSEAAGIGEEEFAPWQIGPFL